MFFCRRRKKSFIIDDVNGRKFGLTVGGGGNKQNFSRAVFEGDTNNQLKFTCKDIHRGKPYY